MMMLHMYIFIPFSTILQVNTLWSLPENCCNVQEEKGFYIKCPSRVGGKMQMAKHPTFLLHIEHYVSPMMTHLGHYLLCTIFSHSQLPQKQLYMHEWACTAIKTS